MRRLFATAVVLCAPTVAMDASALVWPDVPDRIESGLVSPDPATRRAAARELANVDGARATPLVLKALGDADVDVRLAAAQAAARLRVAGATDAVLPWLSERDARLRLGACEVARVAPSPGSVPALGRTLGDADPQVRAACADALGASGSAEALTPLSGKLDDPTPNVRLQVARALARLGDARAVVPLVGKVQDSVPEVRQAVVRALGDLGDTRATQALLLALRDNAPEVKIEALGALGRLRAPDAVEAMAPITQERNPQVRQAALMALGRIGTPAAVRAIVKSLGQQEDSTGKLDRTPVREALVLAKGTAVTELTALLDRPITPAVATSAAWVLGELKATTSAPAIVAALRKGTLPPTAALRALAGAGTASQVPVVLEFVTDPNLSTREEALRAAHALLDPERPDGRAVEPLAATLRTARMSPQERAAVATLLGRTGAPRAAGELVGLVNARDTALRLAAIDALGALGSSPSALGSGSNATDDVLVPLLSDSDPAIRLRAATALAASGGPKARRDLAAKLDTASEIDRFAVLEALGGILERHPDEATSQRLFRELAMAAGPERDAIIVAAGRSRLASTIAALTAAAKSADADDRRTVAAAIAAHRGDSSARALAQALASDADPTVRAEAAFALGAVGDATTLAFLVGLARSGDADVATNAAAALARIASRTPTPEVPTLVNAACTMLTDGRPTVRANALAAVAAAKQRCATGRTEQTLLTDDPSELVRANAARAMWAAPQPEDRPHLERCAATDRSAEVALLCRPRDLAPTMTLPASTHAVTAFIVKDSASVSARPRVPFLLEYDRGVLRAGSADRRGAVFDPVAPSGSLVLRRRH